MGCLAKFVALLILLFGFGGLSSATPFSYLGVAADDIDTLAPNYVDMIVVDKGRISNITLRIEIDSPYADNLSISLVHEGLTVPIYVGTGDSFHSYIDAVFDDGASLGYPIEDTVDGTFKPSPGFLAAFTGLPLDGLWQLRLHDSIHPGDGTPLVSWSIQGSVLTDIPEPSTSLLLFAGLMAVFSCSRQWGSSLTFQHPTKHATLARWLDR